LTLKEMGAFDIYLMQLQWIHLTQIFFSVGLIVSQWV